MDIKLSYHHPRPVVTISYPHNLELLSHYEWIIDGVAKHLWWISGVFIILFCDVLCGTPSKGFRRSRRRFHGISFSVLFLASWIYAVHAYSEADRKLNSNQVWTEPKTALKITVPAYLDYGVPLRLSAYGTYNIRKYYLQKNLTPHGLTFGIYKNEKKIPQLDDVKPEVGGEQTSLAEIRSQAKSILLTGLNSIQYDASRLEAVLMESHQ